MTYWHCNHCSADFDEPIERSGSAGTSEFWGMTRAETETWQECPHCGAEEIDEVDECPECEGSGCVECGANVGAE
jgi:rubrerythrin